MSRRLHPRYFQVQKAQNELEHLFLDWLGQQDITHAEAAIAVTRLLEIVNRYALRAERHPDDPTKKADEE